MKNVCKKLLCLAVIVTIASCGNGSPAKGSKNDSLSKMTDTITDITNPGVGSAADDTTARP